MLVAAISCRGTTEGPTKEDDKAPAEVVELHGFRLARDSVQPAVASALAKSLPWKPRETVLLREHVQPGDVVAFVGAGAGVHPLLAARLVGADGQVLVLDDDPRRVASLRENIELNDFENVRLISDSDRTVDQGLFGMAKPLAYVKIHREKDPCVVVEGMKDVLERSPDLVMTVDFFAKEPVACLRALHDRGFSFKEVSEQPPKMAPRMLEELSEQYERGDSGARTLFLPRHYSQGNEERLIRQFFAGRERGFFLDVGCADYAYLSTTYYLEKHLGWSGIGIDAIKEHGNLYEQHRPNTVFLNYVVSDRAGGEQTFYKVNKIWEISSAIEETAVNQSRRYAGTGDIEQIKVPTITLTEVLDERGVEKIDLLSMDIEGGEPAALAGFDIDRFKPELVCIEAQEGVREDIARYFEEHRYRRIEEYLEMDETNWYFTPKGSEQEGGGHEGGGARR